MYNTKGYQNHRTFIERISIKDNIELSFIDPIGGYL